LRELFPDVRKLHTRRRNFVFRYASAQHFIDVFRTFYGPTHKAFAALDADGQLRLSEDIRALIEQFNGPSPLQSVAIPAEYLEVVIDR
jgi:hypothetical protein